ncbi:transposase [Micrococcus luteus]|nr:transposase [Micrococcus luteus]QZY84237.1 transposase [Micrococcus luteus]RUQ29622.1 hypothetical protein D8M33_03985 [Micrococcus sp. HSID17245]
MALAKRLHAGGDMSAREIADEAGVSASTMYRPLRIETTAVLFSGLTVSPMLLPLLGRLRVARPVGRPRTRPEAVLGDKAYSSRAIRTHLRARRIKAVIPEPADQQGHRRRRGSAGGRPVGLDSQAYKGRNVIERQYAHLKQWRGLATRYDKYAIVYRAAVVLNAVLAWSKRLSDMP